MPETAEQGKTRSVSNEADGYPCRMVTSEEIAHYQEYGWVKLKRFIHPDIVQTILDRARERMGEDADSNPDYGIPQPYFNAEPCEGLAVPPIRELIFEVGKSAKLLMNRKSGVGIRHFQDFFAPKLPSGKKTKNAGNGPTSFHQDFITFAVDRSGGMTFWIPLQACGPEMGTMSFINGSHRLGVLGNYTSYGGRDIREVYPELLDCGMSEQMVYDVGDVTVHSHMCVHGATANMSDAPRWTYIILTQPADACWDGAPPQAFDPSHLTPYQQLDDDHFPITAPGSEKG